MTKLPAFLVGVFATAMTCLVATAVPQTRTLPRYVRGTASRDGIGVFYFGREIAHVMGHEAADWLDRPERTEEEAPELLVKALQLRPGMTIADIGAGSGYLSFMMAKNVAPGGRVLAEDIQPEMLDIVRAKARRNGVQNVAPVLGTVTDPKIAARSVDLMILVDVYHEFDHPYEMVTNMVRCLKPGGRLVFVEYRGEDPAVPIKELHKLTEAQVRREMAPFPLKFQENIGILPRQHILVFTRRAR